jgi:hypothetical protein
MQVSPIQPDEFLGFGGGVGNDSVARIHHLLFTHNPH